MNRPNYILLLAASIFLIATLASSGASTLLLEEDFESYADDAALDAVWPKVGNATTYLADAPDDSGNAVLYSKGDRRHRAFGPVTPTDEDPLYLRVEFYDDYQVNVPGRDYVGLWGGASIHDGRLIEVGLYNHDPALATDHYNARVFGSVHGFNWFDLQTQRSAGWHVIEIIVFSDTAEIHFDGDLDTVVDWAGGELGAVRLGFGAGASQTGVYYDDLLIESRKDFPLYSTNFAASEGFTPGDLNTQDGWAVEQGTASVTANGPDDHTVILQSGSPRARISRNFTEFSSESVVFLDFSVSGGAGEPPSNAPEASSPDAFYVALVKEENLARFYVFAGDGAGSGEWVPSNATAPVDSNGNLLSWVVVTVRLDYVRATFDLYVDGILAGHDYGLLFDDVTHFSKFALHGNPEMDVVLDDFYASPVPVMWENQSRDGITDWWKELHEFSLTGDIRDDDPYQENLSNIERFLLQTGFEFDPAGATVFHDDFESGDLSNWTEWSTGSALTVSTGENRTPRGSYSAALNNSSQKMYRDLGSGVEGAASFTFWIYDDMGSQTRWFGEARTGFQQIFAIGHYGVSFGSGTGNLAAETVDHDRYQGRVLSGTNAGWFNLDAVGAPHRSPGWHKFEIRRLADGTTIEFYVDGVLSRTITGAVYKPVTQLTIGTGIGSSSGSVWFDEVRAEYSEVPVIEFQTASGIRRAGGHYGFSVAATGNVESYQWFLNDEEISGAESSSIGLNDLGTEDAGEYRVVVSNGVGSVTSDPFYLAVVSGEPSHSTVDPGTAANFTVDVHSPPGLSFQWRRNGVPLIGGARISGVNTSTLTIDAANRGDEGAYTVLLSLNGIEFETKPAALRVNGNQVFHDDFSSGDLENWTHVPGSTSLTISGNHTRPGSDYAAKISSSTDKMYQNLQTDVGGHARAVFWIYDNGESIDVRWFGEVRAYQTDGFSVNGNDDLEQVFAIGKYHSNFSAFNFSTGSLIGETVNLNKYQGRVGYGENTGWFNLDAPGSPNVSIGWHKFEIERMAGGSTINFYVDGILSRTITDADYAEWDVATIGSVGHFSDQNPVDHDAWFGGLTVEYIEPSLEEGLQGHWPLIGGSGTTAEDFSPFMNHGELSSSGVDWRFDGYGIAFDSTGEVTVGNPADGSLDFGSRSVSMTAWFRTTAIGWQTFFSKGTYGFEPGYSIGIADGRVFATIGGEIEELYMRTADNFNDGQWHHVAAVFDRDRQRGWIFIDGVEEALADVSGGAVVNDITLDFLGVTEPSASSDRMFFIGAVANPSDEPTNRFTGDLADVRVYNRALSKADIWLSLLIDGPELPELTAEASPQIVCVGETVTFTATAGTEGGFSWSGAVSGDSDTVQAQFSTPGLKEATVTYTINGIGISETITVEVREIVLTASASPATACAGEEIVFSAWASGCSGDYDWTGDASGNEAIVSQVFNEAKTYQGVVRFSRGGTELFETVTVVITEPEIVVTAHPAVVHPGETVTLSAYIACGGGDFVEWTGDATGTNAVMEMSFAAPGVHTATAEFVIDGKSYTEDATVTVKPTVEMSASADEVYPGETITFTAFGQSPSGGSHQWSGDVSGTGKTKSITAKADRDSYTGTVVYKRNGLESRPVSATVQVKRPTLTTSVSSPIVAKGEEIILTAEATGGPGGSFYWSGHVTGYGPEVAATFNSSGRRKAQVEYSFPGGTIVRDVFFAVSPDGPDPLECEQPGSNLGQIWLPNSNFDEVTVLIPVSDPTEPNWTFVPVFAGIVTRCTPEGRSLWGEFRWSSNLANISGPIEFTLDGEPMAPPDALNESDRIEKEISGHVGDGVHDWHTTSVELGFLSTGSGARVHNLLVQPIPDPDPDSVSVPQDDGAVDRKLKVTVMACEIAGIGKDEVIAQGDIRQVTLPCASFWPYNNPASGLPPLDVQSDWHGNAEFDTMHHDPSSADAFFDQPGENLTITVMLDGHFEGETTFHSQPFHVARIDLDVIPVGQTEPLPEEEKNDPGAWVLAKNSAEAPEPLAKATLIVRPTEVSGLTRELEWDEDKLIVRDKATGALVESGLVLEESDGLREFTVTGTEEFEPGDEEEITLKVEEPDGSDVGEDAIQLVHPNLAMSVTWESLDEENEIEDFQLPAYFSEFTDLDLTWLEGWRYFPCAEEPGGDYRDIVEVKVEMPGYEGRQVRLKAFDVDDATPEWFDLEGVIDQHPSAGDDNGDSLQGGKFADNLKDIITVTLDENGEAAVRFRVGSRPGSNYRIAAVLDEFADYLDVLQTADEEQPFCVLNGNAPLDEAIPGAVSPTLTIWRKLHLEVDSMDEVPEEGPQKNAYTGTVTRLGEVKPEGYTTLSLSSVPGALNRFQYGRLTLNGSDYFIRSSKLPNTYIFFQEGFQQTIDAEIEIVGVLDSSVQGTTYILRDDDDLHRDEIGLHPSLPYDQHSAEIVEAIRPKFAPAFVEIVDANALDLNEEPRIPFRLNRKVTGGVWERLNPFDQEKDIEDSRSFWAHTLVIAYQPQIATDRDPHVDGKNTDFGGTPKKTWVSGSTSFGYSVVFIEVFRDLTLDGSYPINYPWSEVNAPVIRDRTLRFLYGTIAHEIGHAPGNQSEEVDHNEGDLMREKDPTGTGEPPSMNLDFTPKSIYRFRSPVHWEN